MRKSNSRERGFSLIELSVVVAILGMLASLAVPNYMQFVAKARQSEAKGYLAEMYSAERAFRHEWGFYTVCLFQAGFLPPAGDRRYYAAGFWGAGSDSLLGGLTPCQSTGGIGGWGGYDRDDATFMQNTWANPDHAYGGPGGNFAAHQNTFKAVTFGSITTSPNWDIWSIDESKKIVNEESGL